MNMEYNMKIFKQRISMSNFFQTKIFNTNFSSNHSAFTLAEVLITLGIIGVVAAITMPVILSNIQGQVKAKRIQNIQQKLSKVTDKMAVQSGLMGYDNTAAFVKELEKHMKIAKVCDNNNLEACWPTEKVVLNDSGATWEIARTKNAKTLKIPENVGGDWSETIGILTADGISMILSYDKTCSFDVDKFGLKATPDGTFSYSTNCISGVYDWNGGKLPNKLDDDVIRLGKSTGLGTECGIKLGGKCFTAPFKPTYLTQSECEKEKDKLGIKNCSPDKDYWAGAVRDCNGVKNMPTAEDLAKLATLLYKGNPTIGAEANKSSLTLDLDAASSLGLTNKNIYIWAANEHDSEYSYYRGFLEKRTEWKHYNRKGTSRQAVCLGS